VKTSKKIFDVFTASGITEWERAAAEELQGADPWQKLTRVSQGVVLKPFYVSQTSATPYFQLPVARSTSLGPRTWYNCPRVTVNNPTKANIEALEHLGQGADGIFFELEDTVDFSILLKSIDWSICSLHFVAKKNMEGIASDLSDYLEKIKGPATGGLFGTLPASPLPTHGSFRFSGQLLSSSPDSVANALITARKQLGNRFQTHAGDVAFSVEIGSDFFVESSKLRALRVVWKRLLQETQATFQPLCIHAWARTWTHQAYDPHGNLLKATTSAMAAILGGCDAITIDAEDNQQATMSRVARNVAIILREESHFSKVADPLAGSYLVDDLTTQLADQIWKKVQSGIAL